MPQKIYLPEFPNDIKIYGFQSASGYSEAVVLTSIFKYLKDEHADLYRIAFHIKNEGKRTEAQAKWDKANGSLNAGVCDIHIPGRVGFYCEVKASSNKIRIYTTEEQIEFLRNVKKAGCFSCYAIGLLGFIEALEDWLNLKTR